MIKENKIQSFLIITFALMYIPSIITIILLNNEVLTFSNPIIQILQIIAGGSPTITAFYFIFYIYDENKKKDILSRLLLFKVSPIWWGYAIVLPFIVMIILHLLSYQNLSHISFESSVWMNFPLILLSSIFAGGLEEIGWRGVLFDEMQDRFSIIKTTLITGIIWALWHLPLFFINQLAFSDKNFFVYLLSTIMFSGFLVFLILKTRSILLTIIMHAAMNSTSYFGELIPLNQGVVIYIGLIALILISFFMIYKTEPEK